MTMGYIPFTDEEKALANSVDLAEFLRMRGEKLECIGREHKLIYYDGSGKHDSITIRGSTWYDHKNQVGGGAIKFMRTFYGMDFQTAMQELLGKSRTDVSCAIKSKIIAEEKKEFKLPTENSDMHRVYAYLIKQRFIDSDIISHFAHQHMLFEDKEHHNAVFVGVDENGIPRQAHLRSTNSFGKAFRITCEGSDTKYSFSHFGNSERLFVFEAPIDMLSYLTLHKGNWRQHSYIAMNGVYENAVLTALKSHSNLDEIVLCTDNDEGGIDAVDRLTDILHDNGYDNISRENSQFKDWNEDLKAVNGIEPLQAVPHKRKEQYLSSVTDLKHFFCKPDKLSKQIYATFINGQYKYLAEYALAGSAFFIDRNNERDVFDKIKSDLICQYKAYSDKGKIVAKHDSLKNAVYEVMRDLKSNSARTAQQMKETSDKFFSLADCAVRCDVEGSMSEHVSTQQQAPQIEESVGLCMG